jgi:hypothetical protein
VKETDLARALGMDFRTWARIRDRDPDAKAAYQEAKAHERDQLVGKLFEAAMGGNITAAIFLLKARHGYRDIGGVPAEGNRVAITFNLPAPLQPEQYEKLVQVAPPKTLEARGAARA